MKAKQINLKKLGKHRKITKQISKDLNLTEKIRESYKTNYDQNLNKLQNEIHSYLTINTEIDIVRPKVKKYKQIKNICAPSINQIFENISPERKKIANSARYALTEQRDTKSGKIQKKLSQTLKEKFSKVKEEPKKNNINYNKTINGKDLDYLVKIRNKLNHVSDCNEKLSKTQDIKLYNTSLPPKIKKNRIEENIFRINLKKNNNDFNKISNAEDITDYLSMDDFMKQEKCYNQTNLAVSLKHHDNSIIDEVEEEFQENSFNNISSTQESTFKKINNDRVNGNEKFKQLKLQIGGIVKNKNKIIKRRKEKEKSYGLFTEKVQNRKFLKKLRTFNNLIALNDFQEETQKTISIDKVSESKYNTKTESHRTNKTFIKYEDKKEMIINSIKKIKVSSLRTKNLTDYCNKKNLKK